MSIAKEITEKLDALGEDADTIAQTLRNLGVKGKVGGRSCPLYHYLHPREQRVAWVGRSMVHIDGTYPPSELVELPEAAVEFVYQFDDGAYPDLVVS